MNKSLAASSSVYTGSGGLSASRCSRDQRQDVIQ